jgi:hypothetical protein
VHPDGVRTLRTAVLCPLVAAGCVLDLPALTTPTTATGDSTGDEPEVTTASGEPTGSAASSGDTGTGDETSTGGDETSAGEPPAQDCPATLPSPRDCGPVPELCGGATPVAGGGELFVHGQAVTADHVWWTASLPGCHAFYRTAKAGGDAQWVRTADRVIDFAADDEAVYLVELTDDPDTMRLHALVDGEDLQIGETHNLAPDAYWGTTLARTRAGVLAYGEAAHPRFYRLSPTGMSQLALAVEEARLGSRPDFDGTHLFFAWTHILDFDEFGPLDRRVVALDGDARIVLADDAARRGDPSVAVDGGHVYFATGDPQQLDGVQDLPMGVFRVAKSGGPVEPVVAPAAVYIEQILVDDAEVFYNVEPHGVFAVAKTGGEPRQVWDGDMDRWMQQDDDGLYFTVREPQGDIPLPGREFVVRVAKTASPP